MNQKLSSNPFRGLVTAIIALVALMFLNFNLVAQTSSIPAPVPPSSLPIYSQDALRSWAMGQVRSGTVRVYSQSMDWDFKGSVTSGKVFGGGGEEVLAELARVSFFFRLRNPDDIVEVSAELFDGNGNVLFGGAQFIPAKIFEKGGGPSVTIYLRDVPIVSGVESAEILVTGEDGKTVKTKPVTVEGGVLKFSPWMAGSKNGILSVRYQTGKVVLYPLSAGVGISPNNYTGDATLGVADHFVYKVLSGLNTIQIRAVNDRPSVYIEAMEDNAVFMFDVAGLVYASGGQYWESPSRFFVQMPDGTGHLNDIAGGGFTLSKKGMSVRIFFEWEWFARPGTIYTGPEDGGGKG